MHWPARDFGYCTSTGEKKKVPWPAAEELFSLSSVSEQNRYLGCRQAHFVGKFVQPLIAWNKLFCVCLCFILRAITAEPSPCLELLVKHVYTRNMSTGGQDEEHLWSISFPIFSQLTRITENTCYFAKERVSSFFICYMKTKVIPEISTYSIIDGGIVQQSWIAVKGDVRWAVYDASTTCLFRFTTSK